MKETTKEEQDEIWEEILGVVKYCIDSSDGSFDTSEFFSSKDDYIILRKPREEIKQ